MENKHLPRDVFLYLLAIVTLVMVSVNLGVLLFQYINIYIPDIAQDRYAYPESYYGSIRWAVASLVIVFPVFLWVTRFLKRDLAANPGKRDLKVRKWLLYLTLFVASLVIIGDLVALVFNFLQGELTTRFTLKILSVLAIAVSIFYYYLNELREGGAKELKAFSWSVIGFTAAAIIAGFVVAGSPQSQRLVRLDQQRVNDLASIQSQIVNYWQSKSRLPAKLSELDNPLAGFAVPLDSETGLPYEYAALGGLKFELCATFKTSNLNKASEPQGQIYPKDPYGLDSSFLHDIGRYCFERTIDPDLYQPFEAPVRRPGPVPPF